jgi:hypothetical protein
MMMMMMMMMMIMGYSMIIRCRIVNILDKADDDDDNAL